MSTERNSPAGGTARDRTPNAARRSEASRRAILTAAFDLVGEVGYARLSIEGIAARAGVGKQTIYRWWPSKGAVLFDAVLMLAQDPGGGTAALPDTGDLAADLGLVLRATVDEFADPRFSEPLRALSTEIAHDPALARSYAERLDGPLREAKKDRLRSAQRVGDLPEDLDLDLAVDLIWGPLTARWLHRTGPLTHAFADALVAAALDGLRGAAAPGRDGTGRRE
ncbi:TetR/AcrR family transcriptional regulator [Streptomonospora nanhaiensis]|uniref:AcrR family transcriptional regulator n=1 Tax=Streptomonospora nanhaiensis TaxID=1323731 RepID=A0A853BTU4_9ACTN|nr:TetR/AcrR family transcriptional regulator [Streptomonospora nanhaiensis]MBV2366043.1 TetR/AcrR family transcriptional regulator [Streptomonospora nanhaiensis]MBX9390455.1 TetR/AcrR family transcriptional regulator [Streptomonospora nanhaiensis]NYI97702.1 AcrR family transcriptional regulator [Streptomonospora nanhaiensis]